MADAVASAAKPPLHVAATGSVGTGSSYDVLCEPWGAAGFCRLEAAQNVAEHAGAREAAFIRDPHPLDPPNTDLIRRPDYRPG